MTKFSIKRYPACEDWKGNKYPEHWSVEVTLRGTGRWSASPEFSTRKEAEEFKAKLEASHKRGR